MSENVKKNAVKSFLEDFPELNVCAFARSAGINEALMRQYKRGGTYISAAQLQKIESAVHELAARLAAVRLCE